MNRSTSSLKLIELPTREAQRLKWEAGREKYGGVFVGDWLVELDYELLDGLNYAEEGQRQGCGTRFIRVVLRCLRWWVWRIYRKRSIC